MGRGKIQPVGKAKIRVTPYKGRFYPRNILAGTAGILGSSLQPLRVMAADGEQMQVDLNHPLAKLPLTVSIRVVGERYIGKEERGGRCNDVVYDVITGGPGMQAPIEGGTDFYHASAFRRVDEESDDQFYKRLYADPLFIVQGEVAG